MKKLIVFDEKFWRNFNFQANYKSLNQITFKYFICFWLLSVVGGVTYIFNSSSILLRDIILHSGPMFIIHHIIHMNIFQIVTFMLAIQFRLNMIKNGILIARTRREKMLKLEGLFVELNEITRQTSKYFRFVLLTSILHLNSSIIINLYWLGLNLLGLLYATIAGEFVGPEWSKYLNHYFSSDGLSFSIPSLLILLLIGHNFQRVDIINDLTTKSLGSFRVLFDSASSMQDLVGFF